jgi:hypothetical protein
VLNNARKDLYLRSRIEELEQSVDGLLDTQRADHHRHNETLAIVIKAATREPRKPSVLFSQLVEDYKRERLAKNKWTGKTQDENMAVYKLCVDIIGDLSIHEIDDDRALTYFETLKQLPLNMNEMPAYRGKTIPEILALNPVPISTRTVNKNVERISSLFKWAMKKPKYDLRYNPFSDRSLDDSDGQQREPFTTDELTRLFGAAEHGTLHFIFPESHSIPSKRWRKGAEAWRSRTQVRRKL